MADRRNVLHTHGKIKEGIKVVVEQRTDENLKEHSKISRDAEEYEGDIQGEHKGEKCSTSQGGGAVDGTGCKRSYKNNLTGNQSAYCVTSEKTKKPLAIVHYQTSCIVQARLSEK